MTALWLSVIGVSEAGLDALPPDLLRLAGSAETVIGPERLLPRDGGTQSVMAWRTPLKAMIEQVLSCRGGDTVILATGDPNWFGIGATLARYLEPHEFALHPAPSAFQLAGARLHWPLQNVAPLSLHGRAVEALHPHILPANRILALTSGEQTLPAVAALLTARGYGESRLTVLEDLGAETERITTTTVGAAEMHAIGDFYVLAIDCVANEGAPFLPATPGLPDTAFLSDGQLTKREVRAATLAKLGPVPGAVLWDVGAGCGSVGIEWMRAARDARALCFERDTARCEMIRANRRALGTPGLDIVFGDAPESLAGCTPPDAVFVGGDVDNDDLFAACWQALQPGGRLVANAVTLAGEQALYRRHAAHGGDLARLEISVGDTIGAQAAMRPRRAVTQWSVIKETAA